MPKKSLFRRELEQFKPYVQGKTIEEVAREYDLERIEKLASNECQFGPSPKAIKAMQDELVNINFYPEGYPVELIKKLANKLGLPMDRFSVGNGGESILWTAAMTLINEGDEIIMPWPSFDIYNSSSTLMGAKVVRVDLVDENFDIDGMIAAINDNTKIIYLCTPNNPTGNVASKEDIEKLLKALPDEAVLFLDEAYYDFARKFDDYYPDSTNLIDEYPDKNIIILRTFSKIYGIAAVRVGYAITRPEIASKMNAVKQTFGVSSLAQAGAKAALDDDEFKDMVAKKNLEALANLTQYFDSKAWHYFSPHGNFIWVDIEQDSKLLFEALQQKGMIVRPGHLWGWPTWLRVSTGTQEQIDFFIECMEETLKDLQN